MVEGKFRFSNGITKNSGFDIGLFTTFGSPNSEEVFVGIEKDASGNIIAWMDIEKTGELPKRSTMDITNDIGVFTDLTLRLDISNTDVVTASIDIGSNGIDVKTMPDSHTLSFFSGEDYSSTFTADERVAQSTELGCDIHMDQSIYIGGETVTASRFSLYNPDTNPVAVECKAWLETPFGPPISVVNIGYDGSFVLPAGYNLDLGPLTLFPALAVPSGTYAFSTRVLNPITGELLCEDLNVFEIQQ